MIDVLADFRVAFRGLQRSKGFAAAGALTLALGIGATTTIFSVVYGVLLRPLPYHDASRLVVIQGEKDFSTGPRAMNYSPIELEEFASGATAFSAIAITGTNGFTLRREGGVELINGATVSGAFFELLDVGARVGRTFDDETAPVIVISDRLRRKLFGAGGDPLGQSITLTDREVVERPYTIVGVMPPEFQYPRPLTDVWRPLAYVRSTGDDRVRERNRGGWEFIARLKEGVTVESARVDAARANDVLKPHFINSRIDLRAKVTPLTEHITGQVGTSLWILLGAVALVLLVACANVANLILARQSVRAREIAMRMALGAPRGRLVAYMLAESGIVAVIGAATGIAIAFGCIRLLQWIKPAQLPRLDAVEVDLPVMLFAVLVAAAAALVAGLGPAIVTTRTDAVLAMRAGSRGQTGTPRRVRSALVVVEIAASIVLLVGAALLARTLNALLSSDLGIRTDNVITAQMDLSLGRAVAGPALTAMVAEVRDRVAAIPAIRAAGFGSGLPPNNEVMRMSFVLNNRDNTTTESHIVTMVPATPGYFEVLQIPLLKGRMFNAGDAASSTEVGMLNREAAVRFFGTDDPIGRTLPFGKTGVTIVGVVENVKYTGIAAPKEGVVFRPFAQQPFRFGVLVARTDGDPALVAAQVRQAIRNYDSQINITTVQPLTTWVSDAVAQPRFRTALLSSIAGITLILAMIGLYGVIAYSTGQRTSEIGVRVAVGAQRADVVRLILAEGARLAIIGTVIGVAGAYWTTRLLASFLYGVTATDVPAFAAAVAALLIVALVATYLPARKASRIDPMAALRAE
jgi:putative ABC transport system permease protein